MKKYSGEDIVNLGSAAEITIVGLAEKIAASVGATDLSWPKPDEALLDQLPRGRAVAAQGVLFTKIEDAQVAEWSERFGGAEA